MSELFTIFLKFIKMIILAALVISVIVLSVSFIFKFKLSDSLNYAGIICMVLGFLSVSGNMKTTNDLRFFNLDVSSKKSICKNAKDDLNLRDSSFNFFIFMILVGILLIMISKTLNTII